MDKNILKQQTITQGAIPKGAKMQKYLHAKADEELKEWMKDFLFDAIHHEEYLHYRSIYYDFEYENNDFVIIKFNAPHKIELKGDSIWLDEDLQEVEITEIRYKVDDCEGIQSINVNVIHNSTWKIYTDSGFEESISRLIGYDVSFSEQGNQSNGNAHLEG